MAKYNILLSMCTLWSNSSHIKLSHSPNGLLVTPRSLTQLTAEPCQHIHSSNHLRVRSQTAASVKRSLRILLNTIKSFTLLASQTGATVLLLSLLSMKL